MLVWLVSKLNFGLRGIGIGRVDKLGSGAHAIFQTDLVVEETHVWVFFVAVVERVGQVGFIRADALVGCLHLDRLGVLGVLVSTATTNATALSGDVRRVRGRLALEGVRELAIAAFRAPLGLNVRIVDF